jgi:hypothetical protein
MPPLLSSPINLALAPSPPHPIMEHIQKMRVAPSLPHFPFHNVLFDQSKGMKEEEEKKKKKEKA